MPRPLPRGPAPRGGHAEGRLPPKPGRRRWLLFGDGVALLDWNMSVSNSGRNINHDPGENSRTIGLSPTTTADQRKGGGAPWPRPVLRYVTERLLTRPRGDLVATGLGLICGSDCLSLSTARRWPGLWNGVRRRKGAVRRECATWPLVSPAAHHPPPTSHKGAQNHKIPFADQPTEPKCPQPQSEGLLVDFRFLIARGCSSCRNEFTNYIHRFP